MRYRRADVVDRALGVLDAYGLADLTMRRLGSELGVQPSALYHHFANKQRCSRPSPTRSSPAAARTPRPAAGWDARVEAVCTELRDAMLAYRDGAELVATVRSFGLGAATPYDELADALADGGLDPTLVPTAARTLLHFVFGHAVDEQTHLQAGSRRRDRRTRRARTPTSRWACGSSSTGSGPARCGRTLARETAVQVSRGAFAAHRREASMASEYDRSEDDVEPLSRASGTADPPGVQGNERAGRPRGPGRPPSPYESGAGRSDEALRPVHPEAGRGGPCALVWPSEATSRTVTVHEPVCVDEPDRGRTAGTPCQVGAHHERRRLAARYRARAASNASPVPFTARSASSRRSHTTGRCQPAECWPRAS